MEVITILHGSDKQFIFQRKSIDGEGNLVVIGDWVTYCCQIFIGSGIDLQIICDGGINFSSAESKRCDCGDKVVTVVERCSNKIGDIGNRQ
ncbi:hypothetical protein K2173_006765 [Erythroxylum novogranatense]|uniref:Uncharacterized protein n=1 Tax=Erythroxylum novogranatense TaxID=1862640 RepID=A0AAV8SYY2_9ROSI|nr:hypothetical protein K2173_006765 [Erythroxylum novogranatense]